MYQKGLSGEDTMQLFFLAIGEGYWRKYRAAPKAFANSKAAEGAKPGTKNGRERKRSRRA